MTRYYVLHERARGEKSVHRNESCLCIQSRKETVREATDAEVDQLPKCEYCSDPQTKNVGGVSLAQKLIEMDADECSRESAGL